MFVVCDFTVVQHYWRLSDINASWTPKTFAAQLQQLLYCFWCSDMAAQIFTAKSKFWSWCYTVRSYPLLAQAGPLCHYV